MFSPQTITTDQGSMFISEEFGEFAASMGIKLLNSSPYYAQANGQAEASNKGIIKLIKRKIEEQQRSGIQLLMMLCGPTGCLAMVLPKCPRIS